jgi:hypothetical protein
VLLVYLAGDTVAPAAKPMSKRTTTHHKEEEEEARFPPCCIASELLTDFLHHVDVI